MILSVSRRTDIPAFYSEWFFNRLQEGYAYVRNPMNPHQVSHVSLSKDVVDGFVFWTKNPAPMLQYMDALQDYTYYFQFTLTSYDRDVEKNLPSSPLLYGKLAEGNVVKPREMKSLRNMQMEI